MVRRTRIAALVTLAMVNVFTLVAGVAVARLLPGRLAALRVATVASGTVTSGGAVLPADPSTPSGGADPVLPSATGLAAALSGPLSVNALGSHVAALVADAATGQVLLADHDSGEWTPASTAKLATAAASLAVLGPGARFSTRVVAGARGSIILVGGGDPTLAVNAYPAQQYPRPATLASLASATAKALRAAGQASVSLGYDTSAYTGPGMAAGWSQAYVTTGNVTPIVSLEVDQGRLTPGLPEDSDDPANLRARTTDPAGLAASAFASLLVADGIDVRSGPVPQAAAPHAAVLASVTSPPLSALVEQMLAESNNVIAENLARHLAVATGEPASFAGWARRSSPSCAGRHRHRHPDGRRQRPVAAGRAVAADPGQGARAGRGRSPAAIGDHGPAGGLLFRHAVGRAKRFRRHRRERARRRPRQNREPGHRGGARRVCL